jgi:hypothetical protein
MENNKSSISNSIDNLMALIKGISRNFVNYVLGALRRYFIIAILVFASMTGYKLYKLHTEKYYESTIVLSYYYFNYKVYGDIADNLNMLAATGSYHTLANVLNIPPDEAQSILSFEGKDMYGNPLSSNMSSDHGLLYFTVKATGNKVFSALQTQLPLYLNNSSHLQNITKVVDLANANDKIKFLKQDIALVDSIIEIYYTTGKPMNYIKDTAVNMSAPLSFLNYKNQLEQQYFETQYKIKRIASPIEVMSDFAIPEEPVYIPIEQFVIKALLISIVVVVSARFLFRVE